MKTAPIPASPALATTGQHPRARGEPPIGRTPRDPAPSIESLRAVAEAVSADARARVNIEVEAEGGHFVLRILDKATGDVINQFPYVDTHAVAARLEDPRGLLFDGTAA